MNKYRSHKTVSAFKITEIRGYYPGGVNPKVFALSGKSERVEVTEDFVTRHGPYIGGYFVRYQDGYESFSPAEAFEGGYTLITASAIENTLKEKVLKDAKTAIAEKLASLKGEADDRIVCNLRSMVTKEVVTKTTRKPDGEQIIVTTTTKEWTP